ncbi:hypothetical protein K1T35_48440 (plasmid) [Pseudonocardia sp. DSM 110487]|uniref:hypothetical protein n=1 Tax=Pseudonocardia sp. DSM 110487 TaxID=2865833 RepID=UPI001C6A56F2|nr:hypothetical protein [Pseudonocardia sp. DSM 110487]QYN41178.1 hypothetical protein K1T35_48440 [Pseudonocardia sp. DSM 110487]
MSKLNKDLVWGAFVTLPKNADGSVMLRELVRECGYGDTSEFLTAMREAGINHYSSTVPGKGIVTKLG